MAWNPNDYSVDNFMQHPYCFCEQIFGKGQAEEAARILNLYTKYNGRVTAEMLDCDTYNLETGEWKQVADDYVRLEAEALRQYSSLAPEYKDAYKQLLLFPVQAMSNLLTNNPTFYPTVARRVVEKQVRLDLPVSQDGSYIIDFSPLDPAVVLEKIVVDYGGYKKSYLYMNESPCRRPR